MSKGSPGCHLMLLTTKQVSYTWLNGETLQITQPKYCTFTYRNVTLQYCTITANIRRQLQNLVYYTTRTLSHVQGCTSAFVALPQRRDRRAARPDQESAGGCPAHAKACVGRPSFSPEAPSGWVGSIVGWLRSHSLGPRLPLFLRGSLWSSWVWTPSSNATTDCSESSNSGTHSWYEGMSFHTGLMRCTASRC